VILAFDTSTKAFSLSLTGESGRADLEIVMEVFHSQRIVEIVDFLLGTTGASVRNLTGLYAGIGPGSFTGIRVGLTFANTLLETLGIPLGGISSLDLLAFGSGRWYNAVVSFIRSRKDEVYAASYREGRRNSEYLALGTAEFERFVLEQDPGCLVASEEDFRSLPLRTAASGREVVFGFPMSRNAHSLAELCGVRPEKKYLRPLYVRNF
jgi:tRNA threonylcarbamoyl adenosine modification protein YeaZ